ncbi:PFL_4704 family integrating conjugative element protein [Klebsiella pneumoniae]|nr:PFL_4704 family integrating conjugative element protein [Klebsiella pneumoniae]
MKNPLKKCRLLLLAGLILSGAADAVELMKWERIPLQVPLTVGQERIVFVNKNVRVGFPPALNNKLRIQSTGGVVYLDASEAFPVTRLELQNKENGIYGHSRFCNTDFDDKLACLNLSGV